MTETNSVSIRETAKTQGSLRDDSVLVDPARRLYKMLCKKDNSDVLVLIVFMMAYLTNTFCR